MAKTNLKAKNAMALYAISVLLQREEADETTTTSHTLHWCEATSHEDAAAHAIKNAKQLKPHLEVVDALCAEASSGTTKRFAYSAEAGCTEY